MIELLRATYSRLTSEMSADTDDDHFALKIACPTLRSLYEQSLNNARGGNDSDLHVVRVIQSVLRNCATATLRHYPETIQTRKRRVDRGLALATLQTKLTPHLLKRSPTLMAMYTTNTDKIVWLNE